MHRMLEKQLQPQDGLKILKKLLHRHCRQRHPFQIMIFDEEEAKQIVDFTLRTFFRHWSLYEFSFKPRIELVLKSEPFTNQQVNAPLKNLDEMIPVEGEEAEKMKMYLNLLNEQAADIPMDAPFNPEPSERESEQKENESEQEEEGENINWKVVGKPYSGGEPLE